MSSSPESGEPPGGDNGGSIPPRPAGMRPVNDLPGPGKTHGFPRVVAIAIIAVTVILLGLMLNAGMTTGPGSPQTVHPLSTGAPPTPAQAIPLTLNGSEPAGVAASPDGTSLVLSTTVTANTAPGKAEPAEEIDYFHRSFRWTYQNTTWSWQGRFPLAGYEYYRGKPHNRENNYAEYVLSDYDRSLLREVVQKFRDAGSEKGYSEYDDVMNIATFVQSLHYTPDSVTTGYDEYPRYPLETLVDDGGDCEDTSILTAALVDELGYGVVLIQLPGHMGVGIRASADTPGTYYEYQGSRYYYLETTGKGWALGELPDEYRTTTPVILPLVQVPLMDMSCQSSGETSDRLLILKERCMVRNIGVGTAKNPVVRMAAMEIVRGSVVAWQPGATVRLNDYPEGTSGLADATLRIPRNETVWIQYSLTGDNFEPVDLRSGNFTT